MVIVDVKIEIRNTTRKAQRYFNPNAKFVWRDIVFLYSVFRLMRHEMWIWSLCSGSLSHGSRRSIWRRRPLCKRLAVYI